MASVAWLAAAAAPAAAVATAVPVTGGGSDCGRLESTSAVVQCHDGETRRWDRRLNAAYTALQQRADASQRPAATAAQRLWVRHRVANCGFYAAGEGTVGRVLAAECMRTTTRERACGLESASGPQAAAGLDCP